MLRGAVVRRGLLGLVASACTPVERPGFAEPTAVATPVIARAVDAAAIDPPATPVAAIERCFDQAVPSAARPCHRAPMPVAGIERASQVAIGGQHSCAIDGGVVRCWGDNGWGQLGDGTTLFRTDPVEVVALEGTPRRLVAGDMHSCAQLQIGTVLCWGFDNVHIGSARRTDTTVPVLVPELLGVQAIAAGAHHVCAIDSASDVRCWGSNLGGALGTRTKQERAEPRPVRGLDPADAITTAWDYACARQDGGRLRCWGSRQVGRRTRNQLAHAIDGLADVVSLAIGYHHVCAVVGDGTVHCWGGNHFGQLGDGTTEPRRKPTRVPGLEHVVEIALGAAHACARKVDGTLACWGNNDYGQLGDGTTDPRTHPTLVVGVTAAISVVAGGHRTCAIDREGVLLCWGLEHEDISLMGATG